MRPLVMTSAIVGIVMLAAMGAGWAAANHDSLPTTDLKRKAASGQAGAEFMLGMRYFTGRDGVHQSYTEALKWLHRSADKGFASAQSQIGYMYEEGYGVARSYQIALHWFKLSAQNGNAAALNNLGNLYMFGHGVKQDYAQARHYFKIGAMKGNAGAQANLGWLYYNGFGVKRDCTKAVDLYRKAIAQDNPGAENNLAAAYFFGCGVSKNNTKALKWALIARASAIAQPQQVIATERRQIIQNVENLRARLSPSQIKTAEDAAKIWEPAG